MYSNRNKHNIIKYLPTNDNETTWGISISSIGFQSIRPNENYPLKGHSAKYTFNPEKGRIIDEFVLVYVTRGEGIFISSNCPMSKISEGDVFFIFPKQWHTHHPIAEIGWDEYYFTLSGPYFDNLLRKIVNYTNPIFHIGINRLLINHLNEMIDSAMAEKPAFQVLLGGTALHIISLIYSINKTQDYGTEAIQKMQKACMLMRENVYENFTSEDIAKAINMSYSNFRKFFKKYVGITPHQYILQLKINKIKELLDSTEMSIQDISAKLNFESPDYFSFFFRKKTGVSPISYRKHVKIQRDKNL
ncbi:MULTISPECIES: AraC family transcriptional regulator [Parabacteroides]|uniref:helix-turn-helix domain-containing protein n=2 Tax=Parabacteroides leei TaxID=2939491 RepID=UPI00189749BD|nr:MULTISPECIES: AraC family transcriptional regulator [Parabacteroides]MCL3854442.1 AraC family transcriptional regulator [Parabacteroides leei]